MNTAGDRDTSDAFNAFEAAGWADRADEYTRLLRPVTAMVVDPLVEAARVGRGDRVLDVGTGPGTAAGACAHRGAIVTGVDVAEEMLALARVAYPDVRFVPGDAQRLPVDDTSVDVVVGNFVILHLGQPEEAVREAARVLSPGGRVALSTWDVPERARILGVILDAIGEVGATPPPDLPAGPPFFRFADDAEFTRLLTGGGFVNVTVKAHAFAYRFASVDALWEMLIDATVRTRALVTAQSLETQRRIRAAFDRLAAAHVGPDGLDMPVSVKIASGVRADGASVR